MNAHIIPDKIFVSFKTTDSMRTFPSSHLDDDELAEDMQQVLAAQSDRVHFETLYNKYYETIFRFVYQRLDSKDTAFDLTHQVFLQAMVNLNKYEIRSVPFSAWLYRIAINELNQYFRKNKKARALNVPLASVEEIVSEMDEQNREEHIKEIISAISTLPEDEIRVVEMRFFEKKGFREIGNILQITENNAKVRTYRILDKIKKIILKKI